MRSVRSKTWFVLGFLAITFFGWTSFAQAQAGLILDQSQELQNYGYWVNLATEFERWQEFRPTQIELDRIDLLIGRNGNPGNLVLRITNLGGQTIWRKTVDQSLIPSGQNWISVYTGPALHLTPEASYRLCVSASQVSTEVENRYFWDGSTESAYSRGISDASGVHPSYDYSFRTYTSSSPASTEIDQTQGIVEYGYGLENASLWERWQEFRPTHVELIGMDLVIARVGNPGNLILRITNSGGQTIWTEIVEQDRIPEGYGWITVYTGGPLYLNPDASYRIYLSSSEVSDIDNRYAWLGDVGSSYDRGVTDVEGALPGYDYAFRTRVMASSTPIAVDQLQAAHDYGFWLDLTSNFERWQEIRPVSDQLIMLDLLIQRNGDPGDLLLRITDSGDQTIWSDTIEMALIPGGVNWVSRYIGPALNLVPDGSYRLYVSSSIASTDVDNRYFWLGSTGSTYSRGTSDAEQFGYGGYDYAFRTYGFGALFLPDLTVESLTLSPMTPTTTQDIEFTAVVRNLGAEPAPASVLLIRVGGETDGTQHAVPLLAPGASCEIKRTCNLATPGAYRTTATADYTQVVSESDEANNENHVDFTVIPPTYPDLVVESLVLSPPFPTTADDIEFTAVVRNQGTASAAASVMRMWVGGESEGSSHEVPVLAPGASFEVKRTVSLTSAMAYRTTAQADFGNTVPETEENNNSNQVDFNVISAGLVAHKMVYVSDETGDGEIFYLALDSSLGVLFRYNLTNRTSAEGSPRWSPDGERIAFQSDYDGSGQVWIMNANGTGKRRVTDAALPVVPVSWSGDGLYIQAIMAYPGDGEMVRVDVATGEITPLTDVPGYNTQYWDLNQARTKVAYTRGYEGDGFSNELFLADFAFADNDFTNIQLLSAAAPAPHAPRFSPSGTRIAVHLDRSSPWGQGIGIINTDNTGFWTPVPVEALVNQTPEWIDENRIVYAHGTDPGMHLYILDLRDLSQTQITMAEGSQVFPDIFSPVVSTARKVDFNEDGHEDVLWRYSSTGGYNLAWFLGETGATMQSMQAAASAPVTAPSLAARTRIVATARMSTISAQKDPEKILAAGYVKDWAGAMSRGGARRGDLRDPRRALRKADRSSSSTLSLADPRHIAPIASAEALTGSDIKLAATGALGLAALPSVADLNWQVVGTGDFNNDGHVDILWRYNGPGGYLLVWYMNGTEVTGLADLPTVADLTWQVAGTGDFNDDGHVDILWRNSAYGYALIWYMDGVSPTSLAALPTVSDLNWEIVGTGDFNNDTHVDILWRYAGAGGYNLVWYLNGTDVTGLAALPTVSDANWKIVGTGDYNNDTRVDIMWRYAGAGGYNLIWFMDGVNPTALGDLPAVPDLNWRIVSR